VDTSKDALRAEMLRAYAKYKDACHDVKAKHNLTSGLWIPCPITDAMDKAYIAYRAACKAYENAFPIDFFNES
jgi:hypothetical protein